MATPAFSLDERDVAAAIKRSATSVRRTTDNIDAALSLLRLTLASLRSPDSTPEAAATAVRSLQTRLREANILSVAKDDHKVVHASLSKLLKACDKASADNPPPSAPSAVFACDCQRDGLHAAIVDHFARESSDGATGASHAATLLQCAMPVVNVWRAPDVSTLTALPAAFGEVHAAGERVKAGDVAPALAWCRSVMERGGVAADTVLTLQGVLYDLNVVHVQQMLCGRLWVGEADAAVATRMVTIPSPATACDLVLAYAREKLPPFLAPVDGDARAARRQHAARLVTAALFLRAVGTEERSCVDTLLASPYADLVSEPMHAHAARAAESYVRVRCEHMRVDVRSPLSVLFQAGMIALPQLRLASRTLRLPPATSYAGGDASTRDATAIVQVHAPRGRAASAAVSGADNAAASAPRGRSLSADAAVELPLDAPVPEDMVFHSIFCCPVSRQPATPGVNPPVLLPCGHVISRESLQRIAATRPRFKCPTCPVVMTAAEGVELKLE